ncbi:hypothetical protein NJI34_43910 [Pseudomonas sp. S 311-6]|uniref:Uncharacterized protein n=1 Tax=Kerstersia gyiorum TaxID=206506 RepID=A0A4Q7MZX0_9BURK|nr:hypothetical protein [Kerstersia gyiorum]MCO7643707.1 hypothetical protein [Pseudomonas sp. S 311-6]KAB0543893.1 hypothetical protein F7P85_04470 [Kerstersia gyiorum]MCH4270185.1 hypothetical protein [Kerstersia gyiorum]MCI1229770.1 hypothetical protein [Kerstersia gyiorum]RZS72849.1 hypothetical protein EV679_0031 [Kerstersia gyiorum]
MNRNAEDFIDKHRYTTDLKERGYTDHDLNLIKLIVFTGSYADDPEHKSLQHTPEVWPITFSNKVNVFTREFEIAYARMKWAARSMSDDEAEQCRIIWSVLATDDLNRKELRRIGINATNARKPRGPRVDLDIQESIIQMGGKLAESHEPHEIVGIISQRISKAPSSKTIRSILREAKIIPAIQKSGT